ncbi:MAG: hypothetical protein PUB44_01215, partial [Clostridium sp.]|nr:hypothetical protein [Clostridium sp.]
KDNPNLYYQSVGSKLNRPTSGRFPLNFTYHLVKHFDGPNDGLVGEEYFRWGQQYQFLTVKGKRGISHVHKSKRGKGAGNAGNNVCWSV